MMDIDLHPAFQFLDIEASQANVIDYVGTHQYGRKVSIGAALNAGHELRAVKASLQQGGFLEFVARCNISRSTSSRWMRLAELQMSDGLTIAEIVKAGGIRKAIKLHVQHLTDEDSAPEMSDGRIFDDGTVTADVIATGIIPGPTPSGHVHTEADYSPPAVQDAMSTPVRDPGPPAERKPSVREQIEARIALLEMEAHERDMKMERVERENRMLLAEAGDALQPKLAVLQEREATIEALQASVGELMVQLDEAKGMNRRQAAVIRKLEGK